MIFSKTLMSSVKETCKLYGIKLHIGKGKYVSYTKKIRCNGFFDDTTKKLAVASKAKNWELTLVHEFSHMLQWAEDCAAWQNYEIAQIGGEVIDKCISGKIVDTEKLHEQVEAVMALERDCEIRSTKFLRANGYSEKKLSEYIQKANAYTVFYLHLEKNGRWYKIGCEPYNLPSVWKKFPSSFNVCPDRVYKQLGHLYNQCV